jgi:hypothetical protein
MDAGGTIRFQESNMNATDIKKDDGLATGDRIALLNKTIK